MAGFHCIRSLSQNPNTSNALHVVETLGTQISILQKASSNTDSQKTILQKKVNGGAQRNRKSADALDFAPIWRTEVSKMGQGL